MNALELKRIEIASDVEAFLNAGGRVVKLPHWVGDKNKSFATESEKRAAKRSSLKPRQTKHYRNNHNSRWHGKGDTENSKLWNGG